MNLSADPAHVKYEAYLYNQGSRELYNRRLHGYADYMDDHRLFEFKCVHELEPVHFIQLALYMYLAKIENQRHLISTHGRESVRHIKRGNVVMVNLFPEPVFGAEQAESLYSDIITGTVIMVEGGQYIISEGDDKVHDLRAEHMVLNLSWAKTNGLLKQYTYYLYNILTDELFTVGGELGKLRQMVDYLIYQKYFNEQKKTDQEFLEEVLIIKRDTVCTGL